MNKVSLFLGSIVLIIIGCLLGIGLDYCCFRPDSINQRELDSAKNVYQSKRNEADAEIQKSKEEQRKFEEYLEKLRSVEMAFANPIYPVFLALSVFAILSLSLLYVLHNKNQTTNENLIELLKETNDKLRIRTKAASNQPTVQLVQLGSSLDDASSVPQLENSAANETPALQIESDVQDNSSDFQSEDDDQHDEGDDVPDWDVPEE